MEQKEKKRQGHTHGSQRLVSALRLQPVYIHPTCSNHNLCVRAVQIASAYAAYEDDCSGSRHIAICVWTPSPPCRDKSIAISPTRRNPSFSYNLLAGPAPSVSRYTSMPSWSADAKGHETSAEAAPLPRNSGSVPRFPSTAFCIVSMVMWNREVVSRGEREAFPYDSSVVR